MAVGSDGVGGQALLLKYHTQPIVDLYILLHASHPEIAHCQQDHTGDGRADKRTHLPLLRKVVAPLDAVDGEQEQDRHDG